MLYTYMLGKCSFVVSFFCFSVGEKILRQPKKNINVFMKNETTKTTKLQNFLTCCNKMKNTCSSCSFCVVSCSFVQMKTPCGRFHWPVAGNRRDLASFLPGGIARFGWATLQAGFRRRSIQSRGRRRQPLCAGGRVGRPGSLLQNKSATEEK
jgi:hypothetical protein